MALLDLAVRWASEIKAFVAVGHVDHGLRGRASSRDASFVRRETARRGLPFRLAKAPVRAYARRERIGLEEASRLLRYRALATSARFLRCGAVLTAHTLNDQAETVLMNLMRGTGPDGLGGMAPISPWPAPEKREKPLKLLRPLLSVRRETLLSYLKDRRIPFRIDATNALPIFLRNRVRPVLNNWDKERPGLADRLGRTAEILRDENDYWDVLLEKLRSDFRRRSLDLATFKSYHKALQRRLLRRTFGLASFTAVERARLFAMDPGPASKESVPGGWIEKKGDRIFRRYQ
jgi:tRNA(Ile)-lysidine synthase